MEIINKLGTEKTIDKLNKVFVDGNVLSANELNQVTAKVDEIIDNVTGLDLTLYRLVSELPSEGGGYRPN